MILTSIVRLASIMVLSFGWSSSFVVHSSFRTPRSSIMRMNGDTRERVNELLRSALGRARSNLATGGTNPNVGTSKPEGLTVSNQSKDTNQLVEATLDMTIQKADSAMKTVSESRPSLRGPPLSSPTLPKMTYRGSPTITHTALAHSLWSSILQPHVDTAIDATCGNGHDSIALARMLFLLERKVATTILMLRRRRRG